MGDLAFLSAERNSNMKQAKFLSVIMLLAFSLPFTYGGCSNGGGGDDGNACAGLVPCLMVDFGDTIYEFVDQPGDPAIILSDGIDVGFGGIYYDPQGDPYPIAIIGPAISCHDGDLLIGAIDWNLNGEVDDGEWLDPMDGELTICNQILSVYDLFLLGDSWHYHEWTYIGSSTLNAGIMAQEKTEFPTDLLRKLIQVLSED